MPLPEREPLPTIIRVKVVNPKAKRYGEDGWIVDTRKLESLIEVDVQFEIDGDVYRYERSEVELVMP